MRLTRYERETIILFNEKENYANIFTYNTDLIERLKDYENKHPQMCSLKEINQTGGHTYILKKSALSIRLMSPRSEASRNKAAESIRKNRKYRKASSWGIKCQIRYGRIKEGVNNQNRLLASFLYNIFDISIYK